VITVTSWPGETVVCIGGGPSLTAADVNAVRGLARVIAINDAYKLAPWADVLYAADKKWIDWHDGVPGFAGVKYSLESNDTTKRPDWQILRNTGVEGLELDPDGLRTGVNGGYQAINLAAVRYQARRILLLGYDMSADGIQQHWFGEHPDFQPCYFDVFRSYFETIVAPLQALGVTVINCSRRTALTAFPCASLESELARLQERAA
jgi:hypothetical protein